MKLTLKQKREWVIRFKSGTDIQSLEVDYKLAIHSGAVDNRIEDWPEEVIRDYMNGKFQNKPKGGRR